MSYPHRLYPPTHRTAAYLRARTVGKGREMENEYRRQGYDVKFCVQCLEFKPTKEFANLANRRGRVSVKCQDCCSKFPPKQGMSLLRSRVLSSMKRVFIKHRNIEQPNITISYMENLFIVQNGLCALTGRKLILEKGTDSISIDRIDSTKGYIKGNVRWVTGQANIAKGEYSDLEFKELCRDVFIQMCLAEGKEVKIVPL